MAITKHEAKEALNHLLLGFEFAEECDFSDDTENGKAKNIIKDIVNNYIASLTEREGRFPLERSGEYPKSNIEPDTFRLRPEELASLEAARRFYL